MTILSDRPEDLAEARAADLRARLAALEAAIEAAGLVSEDDLGRSG